MGRIALFNDTHLTRLRLITSMLDRGYNIAHVREMLSAWEEGKDLGDVLGLETAIAGTWATEKPETDAASPRPSGWSTTTPAFERLVGLGVIRHRRTSEATVVRPKLIEAFNDIRQYGVAIDKLIDIHEQIAAADRPDQRDPGAGGRRARRDRIKPGEALPTGHRNGRTDHDAGAVPHSGRGGGRRDAGVLDRIDHRVGWSARSSADFIEKDRRAETGSPAAKPDHSHSMVPGGLLVTSSTTRLTSGTSLVMRVEMRSSTS